MTRRMGVLIVVPFLTLALVCAGGLPARIAVGHAQTNGWTVRAVLPVPVTGAAASLGPDGKIYIFGGNTFAQSVTNAEVFDPASNTVTPIAPLPVGLSFMSATLEYDGKIYIAGGWEGSETTGQSVGTLLAYDPGTNTYACSFSASGCASSNLAPLPLAVSEEGVAAGLNGLVIVVGGFATAPTNMVQAYDPVKNVWGQGPSYPVPDAGLRAVVSPGGVLYAGLGFDGQNYVNAIHYIATWGSGGGASQTRLRSLQASNPFLNLFPNGWDLGPSYGEPLPHYYPPWELPPPSHPVHDGLLPEPPLATGPVIGTAKYPAVAVNAGGTGGAKPLDEIRQPAARDPGSGTADLTTHDQTYYGTDASDLYVMGGETNGTVSSAVGVYHLATASWDAGPSLPSPTEDATTATANGVVYLIGGDNGTRPSSAILGYNAPAPPGPPPITPTPTATATPPAAPATATPTNTPVPSPTATNTAVPSPTNTPVPLSAQVSVARGSVKAGQRQTVTVQTAPGASVAVTVAFPSGKKLHHSGNASSTGRFTWRFTEPKYADKGKKHTVSVKVTVSDTAGQTASSSTHYSG